MMLFATWGCEDFSSTHPKISSQLKMDNVISFDEEEKKILPYLDGDFTFAESEAREHAMDIANEFEHVDGIKRTINELRVINLPLRNDTSFYIKKDSTPELYVFNFSPRGFAVISADERYVGSIISSPVSSFTHDLHPGYQLVFEGALADLTHRREAFYKQGDSVINTPAFKRLQEKIRAYWEKREEQKTPILSRWLRKLPSMLGWMGTTAHAQSTYAEAMRIYGSNFTIQYAGPGSSDYSYEKQPDQYETNVLLRTNFYQKAPYNNKMGDIERVFGAKCNDIPYGANAAAGCGPIAYLQLLLYYYPNNTVLKQDTNLKKLYDYHYKGNNPTYASSTYGNATLDDVVSNWVKKIYDEYWWVGSGKHCGGTYITDIGKSNIIKHSYGFFDGKFSSFDGDRVQQSINSGKPVLIKGFSKWCTVCYDNPIGLVLLLFGVKIPDPGSGHIWVIDGTRYRTTGYKYISVPSDIYYVTYKGSSGTYSPYGSSGGWTMKVSIPTGREVTSYSWTKTLVNNELHHNFGWGNAKGETSIASYNISDWVRIGTFGRSGGTNYDISTTTINGITPK